MVLRSRKVLNVFVSSPSDCSEERELVESMVAEVNASPVALEARLELRAIRWENLPPGETVERDYQGRIDDLMARAGLDRFEIYLGFMRDRIGTPTRGHPSGTLSEFASARQRRRASGLPGELLFYFLRDPASMTPEVGVIREDFERRGFLYAVAPSSEVFAARLREHLLHIVATWWQWRKRLHRQLRNIRIGAASVAAALALGYLAFDITTLLAIDRHAQEQRPEAAVQLWHDRSDYLPIVRWRGGRIVDASLRDVAVLRLAESLLAQGFDVFTWKSQHLRPFEVEALATDARKRLASEAGAAPGTEPALRLAWAVLAEDWPLLRRLATAAARSGTMHDPPAVRGFIEHAPAGQVRAWLEQDFGEPIPSPIAARILEAVGRRNEPLVTFAALDALHDGRLGDDAKAFDLRLACERGDADCATPAAARLTAWLKGDAAPPKAALELLLAWARAHEGLRAEASALEPKLLRLLGDADHADLSPALIRFLAQWPSPGAARELATRVEHHVSGRISLGFAERVALIEVLDRLGWHDIDRTAQALARRSAADATAVAGASYAPSDGAVQAAYLRFLAAHASADWRLHRDAVRAILARRLRGQFPDFHRRGIDGAFVALLASASASRFMDLYERPVAPIVDRADESLSARRAYLLDLLPDAATRLPEETIEAVCRSIPVDESRRTAFYRTLATFWASTGTACLRSQSRQDAGALPYLAEAGDVDTLVALLPGAAGTAPAAPQATQGPRGAAADLRSLVAAAGRLPPDGRIRFIEAAQRVRPGVDPAMLWAIASQPALPGQELIDAARAELTAAKDPARVAAAVTYLDAVSRTDDLWRAVEAGADAFVALMARVDAFDWLRIAQVLPPPPDAKGLAVLDASLRARHVLLALDAGQASPTAVLNDRLLGIQGKWLGNPLCRLLALVPGQPAAATLRGLREGSLAAVDLVGALPDGRAGYRALVTWLLADVIGTWPAEQRSPLDRRAVSGWMGDSDPMTVRVMAGLTLAVVDGRGPAASSREAPRR